MAFGIVSSRLSVQLTEDVSENEIEGVLKDLGLQLFGRLAFAPNLLEVNTTVHADALEASVRLRDDPGVRMTEPNFEELNPGRLIASDPRYGELWQWSNTGQAGGTAGPDASAEDAWDRTRGAGIRVAVIDNGFLATHEDLQTGILRNSSLSLRFLRRRQSRPAWAARAHKRSFRKRPANRDWHSLCGGRQTDDE
jgi:hypothetical protein